MSPIMRSSKEPLYRRVNSTARGVRHGGGDYRWVRHARQDSKAGRGAMGQGARHGLDYTPLFRFLQSRVGANWDDTYGEAVSRLDRPDPIFWMVARSEDERRPSVRVGESTYFSGLHVDPDGRLARVDPTLGPESLAPSCGCCTHTFNGVPFTRKYVAAWDRAGSTEV